MQWTNEHVLLLIPDTRIRSDGQEIASHDDKWVGSGQHEFAVWGMVQGSGKSSYLVCITPDATGMKCSCPSRKLPCKHMAALMFRSAANAIPDADSIPDWVEKWLNGRRPKKDDTQETTSTDVSPERKADQAKRQVAREAKVARGVDTLRLHLEDTIRRGLSDPVIKSYAYWDKIAAQMVDSQMPMIARRLHELAGRPYQQQSDWISRLCADMAQLYALTEAYQRLDSLPEALRHDVRTALGFDVKQSDVLTSRDRVRDQWLSLGVQERPLDQVIERRTWLYGMKSSRYAMIVEYARNAGDFSRYMILASTIEGELAFYPESVPQRAILTGEVQYGAANPQFLQPVRGYATFANALDSYADALSVNPFLYRFPMFLYSVWLTHNTLIDNEGRVIKGAFSLHATWIAAVTGGTPIPVFGEWNGTLFNLHSIYGDDGWVKVN